MHTNCTLKAIVLSFLSFVLVGVAVAQGPYQGTRLNIRDFFVYGTFQATVNSSTTINGQGFVGSNRLIQLNGNGNVGGGLFSSGNIVMSNGNVLTGRIAAENLLSPQPTVGLQAGSSSQIGGSIDVVRNISISGGSVVGPVRTTGSYTGPTPSTGPAAQNQQRSALQIPQMPVMPTPSSITGLPTTAVTNYNLQPGVKYGNITGRNLTITFTRPGIYEIRSIDLSASNSFVFAFSNNFANERFEIRVLGNMNLGRVSATYTVSNGGSMTVNQAAERIFTEVQGTGAAFVISNGSSQARSRWLGTVYATQGSISIGSGTGNTDFAGALWSGNGAIPATNSNQTVTINSGVTSTWVRYIPSVDCSAFRVTGFTFENTTVIPTTVNNVSTYTATIPCGQGTEWTLGATSTTTPQSWSWTTTGGNISSGANTATPKITRDGIYTATAIYNATCSSSLTIVVKSCVVQAGNTDKKGDENPEVGKVVEPALTRFYKSLTDPSIQNPFFTGLGESPLVYARFDANGNYTHILIDVVFQSEAMINPGLAYLGGYNFEQASDVRLEITGFTVTGWLPVGFLDEVDNLVGATDDFFNTIYATLVPVSSGFKMPNTTNPNLIKSGGDRTMGTDIVREAYGVNGSGVTIGVLSDSYGKKAAELAADIPLELPAANSDGSPIVVKEFPLDGSDEGRAMMQIIYDVAPGAKYKFRTGFISEVDMANGIVELANAPNNCNVIVDDITYITAPHYTEGPIARAVKQVVQDKNVKYFTSAGNFANRAVEANFTPSGRTYNLNGVPGQIHRFSNSGGSTDFLQRIRLNDPGAASYMLVLQWDDPYYSTGEGGTTNDLDIYLTDIAGNPILGYNRTHTPLTQTDPFELLPFRVSGATTINVMVVYAGTGTKPNIKFRVALYRGRDVEFLNVDQNVNRSTVVAHAASPYSMSLGAMQYRPYPNNLVKLPGDVAAQFNPDGTPNTALTVESFSSLGRTISFNNTTLTKPDFTGPDGVNTSVNLGTGGDVEGDNVVSGQRNRFNFFGTSAAAPHAAALAALILEGKSKFRSNTGTFQEMNYQDMRSLLKTTATDINGAGEDLLSGSGLINGLKAMQTFAKPKPTIVRLSFTAIGQNNLNIDERAPGTPQTVTVRGYNFQPNAEIYYGTMLPASKIAPNLVTWVSDSVMTFTLNTYDITDPPVYVFNPPTSGLLNADGGFSNGFRFLDIVKKNIQVKVLVAYPEPIKADTTRNTAGEVTSVRPYLYFGELNQSETEALFRYEIREDDVLQPSTPATLAKYGISNLILTSEANGNYNPGTYLVSTTIPPVGQSFRALYTYLPVQGDFLRIKKLPIKITPEDKVITFGDGVPSFTFRFSPKDGLNDVQKAAVQAALAKNPSDLNRYTSFISNKVAILEGVSFAGTNLVTAQGIPVVRGVSNTGVSEANQGLAEANNVITVQPNATTNIALMATFNALNTTLNTGMAEANTGIAEANTGLSEANTGVAEANNNSVLINSSLLEQMLLNVGVTEANSGVAEANAGVAEVNRVFGNRTYGVLEMNGGVAEANGGVAEANNGGVYLANGILVAETAELEKGVTIANFVPFLNGIVFNRALAEQNTGMAEANNGVAEVNGVQLNAGIKLNSGVAEANTGIAEANTGIAEANNGVAEANSVVDKQGSFTGVAITYIRDATGKFRAYIVEAAPSTEYANRNSGVAEANSGVAEANSGIAEANGGIAEVNVGVAEANNGLAEANSGLAEANSGGNPRINPWEYNKLGVILHNSDFPQGAATTSSQVTNGYNSINAISGINPGQQHVIIPAAFFTDKFDVDYGVGVLTVKKKEPVVRILDGTTDVTGQTVTTPFGTPKVLTAKATGVVVGTEPVVLATPVIKYRTQGANTDMTEPPVNAGSYQVRAEFSGNGLYKSKTETATLVIDKAATAVTVNGLTNNTITITYQDVLNLSASVNIAGTTTAVTDASVSFTHNNSTTLPTVPGTYTIKATYAETANYLGSETTFTLVINKKPVVIQLSGLGEKVFTGSAQPATASVLDNGTAITTGFTVTVVHDVAGVPTQPINVATYNVTASLTSDLYVADNATGQVVIKKAATTVNVNGLTNNTITVTFGTAPTLTATVTAAPNATVIPGATVAFTFQGGAIPTIPGTYLITASYAGTSNYEESSATFNLVINKKAVTIQLSNLGTKTFNGSAQPATATVLDNGTPITTGFTVAISYTLNGATADPINAGTYNVTASLTSDLYSAANATGTMTIQKAPTTVTVNGLTNNTITVTFPTAPTLSANVTTGNPATAVPGATVTFGLASGGPVPTVPGTYTIRASYAETANYLGSSSDFTLVINRKTVTIQLSDLGPKTFNGSAQPATVTVLDNGTVITTGFTTNVTYNGSTALPVNAGTYNVVASLTSALYQASNATGSLVITGIPATITAGNVITNNGAAPTFSMFSFTTNLSLSGLVVSYQIRTLNGATLITTFTSSGNSPNVNWGNLAAGGYQIVPIVTSGGSNYVFTPVPGTLWVNPYGNNTSSIKPKFECVEPGPNVNGRATFFANYSYSNTNVTDVWIPRGPDNFIRGSDGTQVIAPDGNNVIAGFTPIIFKRGGDKFQIQFFGDKSIYWEVSSFERRQKTSSGSLATSNSNRCNNFTPGPIITSRRAQQVDQSMVQVVEAKAYPNPFTGRIFLEGDFGSITDKDIKVLDVSGREYSILATRKISATKVELDLGNLITGNYYIRVNTSKGAKVFRVMKR